MFVFMLVCSKLVVQAVDEQILSQIVPKQPGTCWTNKKSSTTSIKAAASDIECEANTAMIIRIIMIIVITIVIRIVVIIMMNIIIVMIIIIVTLLIVTIL